MKNIGLFIIIVLGSNSCYHSNEGRTDSFELEQNKKIAASYILEVVNNKNLDILEDIFSPNYISHEKNGNNTNSIEDGSLITFLQYLFNAFPDLHYRVIDVIAEGDMVSLNLEAKGTHRNEFLGFKASGNKITFREMFFFKLANRKIMEGWSVVDVEQVKEQLRKQ